MAHPLQVLAQFVDAVLRNATPWVLDRQTKHSQSPIWYRKELSQCSGNEPCVGVELAGYLRLRVDDIRRFGLLNYDFQV